MDSLSTLVPVGTDKIAGKATPDGFVEAVTMTNVAGDPVNPARDESIADVVAQLQIVAGVLADATILLASMLHKMPRVDANGRAVVNINDTGSAVAVTGSLTSLTTLSTLTTLQTLGTNSAHANNVALHLSRAGNLHFTNLLGLS